MLFLHIQNLCNMSYPAVQYLLNDEGEKHAIVLPFGEWKMMTARYQKLRAKYNVLLGIQNSLKEIRQAARQGKKLQTLDDFLSENSCQN